MHRKHFSHLHNTTTLLMNIEKIITSFMSCMFTHTYQNGMYHPHHQLIILYKRKIESCLTVWWTQIIANLLQSFLYIANKYFIFYARQLQIKISVCVYVLYTVYTRLFSFEVACQLTSVFLFLFYQTFFHFYSFTHAFTSA